MVYFFEKNLLWHAERRVVTHAGHREESETLQVCRGGPLSPCGKVPLGVKCTQLQLLVKDL